jgi:hypothetical protein
MTDLPEFTDEGLLPPGDFVMTIAELKRSMLVTGPRGRTNPEWDAGWRGHLVNNLGILVAQLHAVGVTEIYADGSFVEDRPAPRDIDGYFECDRKRLQSGELEESLNALDPHKVWTWSAARRTRFRGYPRLQLPMWHQYRVELYPEYGQFSGLIDEFGHRLTFPSAFRRSKRNGRPRGIIKIGASNDTH